MTEDLASLDATAHADLVRSGETTPLELVEAAITRIERLNPGLNAVIHPLFDRARREAASPDLPDGPFRGVPLLLKDLICHRAGDPMHEGMRFLARLGWVEPHDSFLAKRFQAAGFVTLGRTNTPELGILPTTEPEAHGPTRNPWDTSRSPGGSSGGSAAAVASGMVPVAHGNDGGGSIRIPASACGLVGLKPTRGRTSLGPDWGDGGHGLFVEHVLTRSVRDTAAILDVVCGPMPGDPHVAPPPARPYLDEVGADSGRLRIGMLTDAPLGMATIDPECVTAAESAARLLESLGHVVEASHPDGIDDPDYVTHFMVQWSASVARDLLYWERRTGSAIGADDVEILTWALAEMGRGHHAGQLLDALDWLQRHARVMSRWWSDGWDLLLTPTMAEPPPLGEFDSPPDNPLQGIFRAASLVPFTPPFNVTGQPAISLPLHWTPDGLPVGVQLVAAFGREDVLLRVAAQLEHAQPWADRRPRVHA